MTSLVNTETGEILDVETAEMRASFICTDLDMAAGSFETAMDRMRLAISERDDVVLGYRSPGDYLSDRFGGRLARLGVDLRREVVRELTEAGLSKRAIAPVVGVSHVMVGKDRAAIAGGNRVTTSQTPKPVAGGEASADLGHTPEGASTDVGASEQEASTPSHAPRPPVTGIDGKTYAAPAPRTPKPVLDGTAAEYDNAAQGSLALARAITKLLQFQHPTMRASMRRNWSMASAEVPPTPRRDVTPEQMRAAAHGLLALADEWESL